MTSKKSQTTMILRRHWRMIGLALGLLAAVPVGAWAAEKILFKPFEGVVFRIDDRAPKLWTIYKPDRKDLLLIQLGLRYLLVDAKEKRMYELDPAKLAHKGKDLMWDEADRPAEALPTEDWLVREVGPARRIRVKLSSENRVFNIEVVLPPDQRTRRY